MFAFHDDEEIGPKMLARVARSTGLRPEELSFRFACRTPRFSRGALVRTRAGRVQAVWAERS